MSLSEPILDIKAQQWEKLRKLRDTRLKFHQPQNDLGEFFAINAPYTSIAPLFKNEKDEGNYIQDYTLSLICADPYTSRWLVALIARPFDASVLKVINIDRGYFIPILENEHARECQSTLVIDHWSDLGSLEAYFRSCPLKVHSLENVVHFVRDCLSIEHEVAEEVVEGFAGSHLGFEHALGFKNFSNSSAKFAGDEGVLKKFYRLVANQFPPVFREGNHVVKQFKQNLPAPFDAIITQSVRYEGVAPLLHEVDFPIGNFEDVPPNRVHVGFRRTDNHSILGPQLQASLATPFPSPPEFSKENCDIDDLLQVIAVRGRIFQPRSLDNWRRKFSPQLERWLRNMPFNTPETRDFILDHTELNAAYMRTFEARTRLEKCTLSDEGLQKHSNLCLTRIERVIGIQKEGKDTLEDKARERLIKKDQERALARSGEQPKAYLLQGLFHFVRRIPAAKLVEFMQQSFGESRVSIEKTIKTLVSQNYLRRKGNDLTWGRRSISWYL